MLSIFYIFESYWPPSFKITSGEVCVSMHASKYLYRSLISSHQMNCQWSNFTLLCKNIHKSCCNLIQLHWCGYIELLFIGMCLTLLYFQLTHRTRRREKVITECWHQYLGEMSECEVSIFSHHISCQIVQSIRLFAI